MVGIDPKVGSSGSLWSTLIQVWSSFDPRSWITENGVWTPFYIYILIVIHKKKKNNSHGATTTYVKTYVGVPKNISGSAPKSWIIWINVPQMASVRQKRWSKILDQDPHSVIQLDPRCEDSLRHRNVGSFGSFVITYWLNVGKNEWSKWSNIAMTQSNVSTLAWQGVWCQGLREVRNDRDPC